MDNILKGIGKDRMEALDLLAARQGFGSQQAPRKSNAIIDYWGEYERSLGGVGANEGSGEDAGFLESAIKGAKAQAAGGLGGQV
ncbi:MAG: hypothetical protein IKL58_01295, partial [Phascolarctobacterium sp.]|nr:hypothetical protein [Phascolarctobacterium sp.]